MQGKILDYNNEFKSGLIRGDDGKKYRFSIDDCKSAITPKAGADVDFEPNGDKAVEVYVMTKDTVDDIKDVASSAIGAATIKVQASKGIIKKIIFVIIGIVIIFVAIGGIATLTDHLQKQKEQQRIIDLKNQCNNNNAKACYEYSMELKYYSGELTIKARNEALAKGCQLGNKDACREGEYYKEGCELQDGESCYQLAVIYNNSIKGTAVMCAYNPGSSWCDREKREEREIKEYYQKACDYGYSQGCIQK